MSSHAVQEKDGTEFISSSCLAAKNFFCRPEVYTQLGIVTGIFVIVEIILGSTNSDLQWHWLSIYFLLLCGLSPFTNEPGVFFKGGIAERSRDHADGFVLGSSAFISWIFAKSITNASKLGAKYGITGGWAYASWYISFASAAMVIYRLRKKGYSSLPEAIYDKYGMVATLLFACALAYRLYNEIWSNSVVVASFYGDEHESQWWLAAIVSTAIPLTYVLMGGMQSSLLSDVAQAGLGVFFLFFVLGYINQERISNDSLKTYLDENHVSSEFFYYRPVAERSPMTLEGGQDLLIVGALQAMLSYPFFDPVLTDRCFMAHPKLMVRSFIIGGGCAGLFIMLFSIIGVYGNMLGSCLEAGACSEDDIEDSGMQSCLRAANLLVGDLAADARASCVSALKGGAPPDVARTMGDGIFSLVNIIMMTSSISTLDSTFTAVAKLVGPDLAGFMTGGSPMPLSKATADHMMIGRVAMVVLAIIGTLPLMDDANELNATTVSGTVVMGLGPPIYMLALMPSEWLWKGTRPLAFIIPVIVGASIGICYQIKYSAKGSDGELLYPNLDIDFSWLKIGTGSYGLLLGVNVLGAVLALPLWFIFNQDFWWSHDADEEDDELVTSKLLNMVEEQPFGTSIIQEEVVKDNTANAQIAPKVHVAKSAVSLTEAQPCLSSSAIALFSIGEAEAAV
ncbi:hypothetical protein CYMTET_6778 [Cymbomonas tetramitiformis]|uniref:Uncharacterized protein n=1 Tax=Cymbomonas tetramitiformis TaxID=36881 RepID=A0AAE0GWR9_9CHLO|nr:hypothetical protein CYMTET_6778 [Cymbomonas tetramitiformis]